MKVSQTATEVRFTSNWRDELSRVIVDYSSLYIICSAGAVTRGAVSEIVDLIGKTNTIVRSDVEPNPSVRYVTGVVRDPQIERADLIVAFGGGSVLDTAKVAAFALGSPRSRFDMAKSMERDFRIPLVAIPTTAGTGAEVTPFATVWDTEQGVKRSLEAPLIRPSLALIDASLLRTLEGTKLLYPALDTASHLMESMWTGHRRAETYAYSVAGLEYSIVGLKSLVGREQPDYEALSRASVYGGLAIAQSRTSISHSISYPLTLTHGVPHGLACSLALPHIWKRVQHRFSRSSLEYTLMTALSETVAEMRLHEQVLRYASKTDCLSLVPRMFSPGRSDNFMLTYDAGDVYRLIDDCFSDVA